jgi:protein SCO1/2
MTPRPLLALLLCACPLAAADLQKDTDPGAVCEHCGPDTAQEPGADPFLEPDHRAAAPLPDLPLADSAGAARTLGGLADRPLAITFVYTRCGNPNKCPRAAKAIAGLHARLAAAGLGQRVRVALMTYDPEFDTPERFAAWAGTHGVTAGDDTLLLRPDAARKRELFSALGLGVNFDDGGVNIHSLELLLLDRSGRIARRYHSVIWNDDAVVADLARLADEAAPKR